MHEFLNLKDKVKLTVETNSLKRKYAFGLASVGFSLMAAPVLTCIFDLPTLSTLFLYVNFFFAQNILVLKLLPPTRPLNSTILFLTKLKYLLKIQVGSLILDAILGSNLNPFSIFILPFSGFLGAMYFSFGLAVCFDFMTLSYKRGAPNKLDEAL